MAFTRREDLDWTTKLENSDDHLGAVYTNHEMVIAAGAVWATVNILSTDWVNYLEGFDKTTGVSVGRILLPDNGTGSIQYPLNMELDQNGYIWLPGQGGTPNRFNVVDPVAKAVVTTVATTGDSIIHFDPTIDAMWAFQSLNVGSGTYRAISTVSYTTLKDITIPRASENIGSRTVDTTRGRLWFLWGSIIKVYDTGTGAHLTDITPVTQNKQKLVYVPQLDIIILGGLTFGGAGTYEIWDAATMAPVLYTLDTNADTGVYYGLFYDPNTGGLVGKGNPPGIYDTWPSTLSLTPPHDKITYSDTSAVPFKDMQNGVYTVDPVDGSIYLRLYDDSNYEFYVHKIAFGPIPSCFHTTGAGGRSRCDGVAPVTPIANNRNTPYV